MDNTAIERRYRMYSLILSYLSPIQKGVQMAHSIVELGNANSEEYRKWAEKDKTVIMLEGGTLPDMEDTVRLLRDNCVPHAVFKEEDLGGITTSVSLIASDQVFDRKEYPDYEIWCGDNGIEGYRYLLSLPPKTVLNQEAYDRWTEFVGGRQNIFLRELLGNRKLAR